ncbi:serine/threonine-protein kinase mos-like [Rhodnius prolixus]|uniref:serine/threonine-protein kinase mos-like n=1 Tax=Rhodnius prolixus TaxID=13249 RepID=UPI003D18E701
MASPIRSFKRSSPRYLSAAFSNVIQPQNSAKFLSVPDIPKTASPLISKPVRTLKNSLNFDKPSQKAIHYELWNLMYYGIQDENKYRILGKGGFGTVVLLNLKDRNVAVKVLMSSKEATSLAKEKNALGLNHSSLVKVFDVLTNADAPYGLVVMEPWFSLNLHTLIHNTYRPITSDERLRYLLSISAGLEYCHSLGIIHLDVKPLNILVDPTTKTCKLCDFGASYNYFKNEIENLGHNLNHQGTIAYAAPELLRGDLPTVECDTYSFGITMWQFLHCDLPYKGIPKEALIYKVVSLGERPKCFVFHEPGYSDLYRQCWNSFPGNRPSMSKVRLELQALLSTIKNIKPIFQLL